MKVILIAWIALLLLLTHAKRGDPALHRGSELINWVEGAMKGTFIIFFYDQDASAKKTSEVRQEVKSRILDKYPDFHYYELDVTDTDFETVVGLFEIDTESLKHQPTLLIASDGKGFWAHGKGAVAEIAYKVPAYSSDLRVPDSPPSTGN